MQDKQTNATNYEIAYSLYNGLLASAPQLNCHIVNMRIDQFVDIAQKKMWYDFICKKRLWKKRTETLKHSKAIQQKCGSVTETQRYLLPE